MTAQHNRYEFPALRRRLTLLQQELYEMEKVLDINRRTADASGDLMRYQLSSDALSREIDELTWALQYLDNNLRLNSQWPPHYWALFVVLAGIGAVLTAMLIQQVLHW